MKIFCCLQIFVVVSLTLTSRVYSEQSFLYNVAVYDKKNNQILQDCIPQSQLGAVKSFVIHIQKSIRKAERNLSKLSPKVLKLSEKSSTKVVHLFNNLCSYPNTRYLEIGDLKLPIFVSALYDNQEQIDDAVMFTNQFDFDHSKDKFIKNCNQFLSYKKYQLYSLNSTSIDLKSLLPLPVNMIYIDSPQLFFKGLSALTYFDKILDNNCIIIIDNWNNEEIRRKSYQAFKQLNYNIFYQVALPALKFNDQENWWNGLYIAVISKKSDQ